MNPNFMQKETVRGMGDSIPKPRPLEGAPQMTLEEMGYGDSSMKCEGCTHYDAAQSMCKLASDEVDPMGHCSHYEAGQAEEMPEEQVEE